MKKTDQLLKTAAVILGLSTATGVYADAYVGAGIGQGASSDWCNINGGACEDSATGYKLFLGGNINQNLGAEIAVVDFGGVTDVGYDVNSTAMTLSAVGTLPVSEQLNLLGKLGFGSWKFDAGSNGKDTGTDLAWGMGAQFNLSSKVGMRAEYESVNTGEYLIGDLSITSLSALVRF